MSGWSNLYFFRAPPEVAASMGDFAGWLAACVVADLQSSCVRGRGRAFSPSENPSASENYSALFSIKKLIEPATLPATGGGL